MSGMQAQTERDMLPKVGATFFRDDEGDLLFQFVVDSSNIIGPRPATRADQDKHPAAWNSFVAAEGVSALDRDAKGGVGGSLPQESPVPIQAPVLRVPPAFDEAQVSDPKVDEQDYQPGETACGPPMADAEPKPKRKYTRRTKD